MEFFGALQMLEHGAIAVQLALHLLAQIDPRCATAGLISYCTAFSLLNGAIAGVVVALRERDRAPLSGHWLLAVGVALLMASLGCVRVGIASIVGVAIGILVGRTSMRGSKAVTPSR